MSFELVKGQQTLKKLIPDEIWALDWSDFFAKIRRHKNLQPVEKIFLMLFKKYSPNWDITQDSVWALDILKFKKDDVFGLIKVINPGFGILIMPEMVYEHIKKNVLMFDPATLEEIEEILGR